MSYKSLLLVTVGVGLLASPAIAQTASPQGTVPADKGVGEIVVTAQKREQNVQTVPVAVSVVNSAAIERANIASFSDITRVSPSLTIAAAVDANNSSIYLRGIGTFSFSIGLEPSVSVVVDDVAVVQQAQAFTALNDIERIEVLRGPQGTLFGRNASAGVVSIVTKAPSKTLTGSVEASYTNDGQYRTSADVSGPLSAKVGFRINAYYDHLDGYINNLNGGPKLNGGKGYGFRGKLNAELTDNLDLSLIGSYSKDNSNGGVSTLLAAPAGAKLLGAVTLLGVALPTTIIPGPGNFNADIDGPDHNDSESYSGQAKLSLKTGIGTLSSVSAYQHWSYFTAQDVDGTAYNIDGVVTKGVINGSWNQSGPFSNHAFTEEFRLTSPKSDRFEYLFGLFYNDAQTTRGFMRAPISSANWNAQTGSTTKAAFGQLTYHILPHTVINGGLRFNHQDISVNFNNIASTPAIACPTVASGNYTCTGNNSQDAVTGKVSLQQFLQDGTMLFASYATGYKGQGYDVSSGFTQNRINNPIQKETSKSYEIGIKGKAFNNAVRYGLTGFWTDYVGYQAQTTTFVPLPAPGAYALAVTNVGNVRTRGVEFEASARLSEAIKADLSAAYTDAYITSFPNAQCYVNQTLAAGCVPTVFTLPGGGTVTKSVQNLAGARLANAPEVKLTANLGYQAHLGSSGVDGFANLSYQWQSSEHFDLFGDPLTTQGAYGIVNANVGIMSADSDRYKVTLFVNNLFDKHYAASIANAAQSYGGAAVLSQQLARESQRYFGIRLKAGF